MPTWLEMVVAMEITVFVLGCLIGLMTGREDLHPAVRCLWAGVFYALWFVTIPMMIIDNRRGRNG